MCKLSGLLLWKELWMPRGSLKFSEKVSGEMSGDVGSTKIDGFSHQHRTGICHTCRSCAKNALDSSLSNTFWFRWVKCWSCLHQHWHQSQHEKTWQQQQAVKATKQPSPKLRNTMNEEADANIMDLKSGPFGVLYKAVRNNTQVLVNVRNNHKLLGRVKAYDRHMNLWVDYWCFVDPIQTIKFPLLWRKTECWLSYPQLFMFSFSLHQAVGRC